MGTDELNRMQTTFRTDVDFDEFILAAEEAVDDITGDNSHFGEHYQKASIDDFVKMRRQSVSPQPIADPKSQQIALSIYNKIDRNGVGYIDRPMLREYCTTILRHVNPQAPFDEQGFESGFKALDQNHDNKITLLDLINFTEANKNNNSEQLPEGFLSYSIGK